MTETVESGAGAMQLERRVIEVFRYVEPQGIQPLAGAGEPLPEMFPESQETESHRSSRPVPDCAYAPVRGRGSDLFPQTYTCGIDPGLALEGLTENGTESGTGNGTEDSGPNGDSSDPVHESEQKRLLQQLLASESQQAEQRGHSKGMEMGLALGREEALRQLQGVRERLVAQAEALLDSFSHVREQYLHQLEQEAVKLALAIAARVLRREAQMDPLLLTGAVRVALGQLAASTSVRLRVPAQDQPMWEEAMARMPGLPLRPQVVGDARMELGDCQMETELGSADLGLWPQLKAIERGFFDRPGDRAGDEPGNRFGLDGENMDSGDPAPSVAAVTECVAPDRSVQDRLAEGGSGEGHGSKRQGNVD